MKTEDEEVTSWDDMMFENRNKEYGAYVLRKSYSENMITGEVLTFFFIAFLFIVPLILERFGVKVPHGIPTADAKTIFIIDPYVKPIESMADMPKPERRNNKVAPLVTSKPQENDTTALTHQDEPLTPAGDGTGGEQPTGEVQLVVTEPPVVDENRIVDWSEVSPAYEGGMEAMTKFLQRNIKYPAPDKRLGTEGTVFVSFVVDRRGKVTDVKIVRGISSTCDKEATRVISMMPEWHPGANNKVPVSVRMVLPIKFKLDR